MQQFESKQDICQWLNQFTHSQLIEQWASTPGVVSVLASGVVKIEFPFVALELETSLSAWLESQFVQGVARFEYQIDHDIASMQTTVAATVAGVKNIIAVTSAKGGVGKSTTSVNLALALSALGTKVGILDADIYGPSIPLMLGSQDQTPQVFEDRWMQPVEAHGVVTNSVGYLVDKNEAAIWRGPMASKALSQLLNETRWPDLDYLVIDMPPGTGDIQLTLSQQIPVTTAAVVSTPQDLALADARKGAAMLQKVDVPVAGVIENMSYHICSNCGHHEAIFGSGGAVEMAKEYGLPLLAQLPLHIQVREDIDAGKPTVVARPDSEHTQLYLNLASQISSQIFWQGKAKPKQIDIMAVE
ncbi:iron-sulfur cluster carrier protein ApbC [Vibrio sp. SCSIO 43136]|uniref:iron-sulfur cluster carrier protein ApbC n=1 Tax=Vibrio sp. SCSIO 43136 TaxID=2819101 RepID=UPI002074D22B|nr:iron-sulfur cluster carrier protein ApbC [Vibrio sp. SCSIO 43136]USD64426.1 iron-sulfur cluster carrier protein ApbC [Vibrio sp. SCSIO 43136]